LRAVCRVARRLETFQLGKKILCGVRHHNAYASTVGKIPSNCGFRFRPPKGLRRYSLIVSATYVSSQARHTSHTGPAPRPGQNVEIVLGTIRHGGSSFYRGRANLLALVLPYHRVTSDHCNAAVSLLRPLHPKALSVLVTRGTATPGKNGYSAPLYKQSLQSDSFYSSVDQLRVF
jgi:hypothetical protein